MDVWPWHILNSENICVLPYVKLFSCYLEISNQPSCLLQHRLWFVSNTASFAVIHEVIAEFSFQRAAAGSMTAYNFSNSER